MTREQAVQELLHGLSRPIFVWRMWTGQRQRPGAEKALRGAAAEVDRLVLRYMARRGPGASPGPQS